LYCNGFEVDPENAHIIESVYQWLTNDPKFNIPTRHGLQDLEKGFLFMGNPGTGKTTLLEILQIILRNTPFSFKKCSCTSVVDGFSEQGANYLKTLSSRNVFFDDLGLEKVAMHYGDKRELMQEVIFTRYDKLRLNGLLTHFTTMLTEKDLIDRYGEFAWSRVKQMCNIFILGGKESSTDRRKNKVCRPPVDVTEMPLLYISKEDYEIYLENKRMREAFEKKKNSPVPPTVIAGRGSQMKTLIDTILKRP
jgi:energy-coupling factor transporter ATP-binding protein EcfA2